MRLATRKTPQRRAVKIRIFAYALFRGLVYPLRRTDFLRQRRGKEGRSGALAVDRLAVTNWEERAEIKKPREARIYPNWYGVVLLNLDSAAFEEYAGD